MKKSKLYLFGAFCMVPLMLLTACDEPKYFNINVAPDSQNGYITGQRTSSIKEGVTVEYEATSYNPETSPFVCWIKDDQEVCSISSNLSLVASEETQGSYTAVFDESNKHDLKFAYVKEINYEFSAQTQAEYTITYTVGYDTTATLLATGLLTADSTKFTLDIGTEVFRLVDESMNELEFVFYIDIVTTSLIDATVSTDNYEFSFSNVDFGSNSTLTNEENILVFEKVGYDAVPQRQ